MTDKELLELAAKAAGIDPKWDSLYWQWNPLTDDGDALRLAVKLRIKSRYNAALGQALAWTGGKDDCEVVSNIGDSNGDECAATRCAIVRAAAELGKIRSGT